MKSNIGWWVVKVIAVLGGWMAWPAWLWAWGSNLEYVVRATFPRWRWLWVPGVGGVTLGIVCAALLVLAITKTTPRQAPPWRRIDFLLLAALISCAAGLIFQYNVGWFWPILRAGVAAYVCAVVMLAELVARLRDREFKLVWPRFFRTYPPKHPISVLLGLFLACDLLIILFMSWRTLVGIGGMAAVIILFTATVALAVLTYVAYFIVTLAEQYGLANAEKLRAERMKVELITNVSHDIRTPLTSIINSVDLMKRLPIKNPKFVEYMGVLDTKATRLKVLVDDLIEASRAGSGNLGVDLQDLDLAEMVGQAAGEFDEQLSVRDLTLVVRQDEAINVRADSRHLWRVLENLLSNAAKYALPGTRVFIQTGVETGQCVLRIQNTSRDPLDVTGDLSERFIRADRSRHTDGNGLGLYIAKSLTELMGGRLEIRLHGDLFEVDVHLPKVDRPPVAAAPDLETASQDPASGT